MDGIPKNSTSDATGLVQLSRYAKMDVGNVSEASLKLSGQRLMSKLEIVLP